MPRDYSFIQALQGSLPDNAIQAFQLLATHLYDLNDQVQRLPRTDTKPPSTAQVTAAIQQSKQLNVSQFLGVLAQPQNAGIYTVSVLPDQSSPLSQDGGVVRFGGVLYVFDATTEPGSWVVLPAVGVDLVGLIGAIPAAASVPAGSKYYATDNLTEYVSTGTVWVSVGGAIEQLNDAATNTISTMFTLSHMTSGAAGAGFGSRKLWRLENGSGTEVSAAYETVEWADATAGSEDVIWRYWVIVAGVLTNIMSITGTGVQVPDEAYGAGWNGSTEAPTKNAVYDKTEAVIAAAVALISDAAYGAGWDGDTTIGPSKNAVYDKVQTLLSQNGVNFGPAAVASITVVNGQIVAIS